MPAIHPHLSLTPRIYTYLCWFIFFFVHSLLRCSLSITLPPCLFLPGSASLSFSLIRSVPVHWKPFCSSSKSIYSWSWLHYHNTMCSQAQNPYFNLYESARALAHALVRLPSFALNLPSKQFEWFHLNLQLIWMMMLVDSLSHDANATAAFHVTTGDR